MPLYEFACPECKTNDDIFRSIEQRDVPEKCACGLFMYRRLSPIRHEFVVPPQGHYYESLGKHCGTEAEFRRESEKTLIEAKARSDRKSKSAPG